MKKVACILAVITLASCSSTKTDVKKPLFEVLLSEEYGGANFQFYEVLDSKKEINMLLSDKRLKRKVTAADIEKSNFVLLNMGEKNTGGYKITVTSAEELPDKIVLKVKESQPEGMATMAITQPFAIVRVNSKKPIVFE
ncbi:MAG: protease complex subunit PrcB family protein [Chitinophagaceae bacterium]|nr:MAG: protease complex subunit PrcB family protein [Chitinophagaceae bacterium]